MRGSRPRTSSSPRCARPPARSRVRGCAPPPDLVTALRAAAGTVAGAAVEPARAPRRVLYGTLGIATLGVCIAGAAIVGRHEDPSHAPAVAPEPVEGGTVAIDVTSTPDGALVELAGKPQGATPRTLHLTANAHVD